jgi:hypothetical protein
MRNDADLMAALEQCQTNYNKFLLVVNSIVRKGYTPVFDVQTKKDGEIEAVNWRLEKYEA